MSIWSDIRAFVLRLWPWPALSETPPPSGAAEPAAPTSQPRDERATDVEETGRWYFKRDILDRLDSYFGWVGRMRRIDPDGYALFARLGGVVGNASGGVHKDDILGCPAEISFGAVFLGRESEDDDSMYPRFSYFQKLDRSPAHVQPARGTIYAVSGFWVDEQDGGLDHLRTFWIAVDADGAIRCLKSRHQTVQWIGGQRRGFKVSHQRWSYPEWWNDRGWEDDGNPHRRAAWIFCWLYRYYAMASADVRVRVERDGLVASFAVDLLRTPYFFRDRDVVLNENGNRKRIFHIVRTHARHLGDGRQIPVRSHFRGERSFTWAGYSVLVTMPGLHHADLLDARFAATDSDIGNHAVSTADMAALMDGVIKGKQP